MVPSEQTQPSPSTWHCSGSSGASILSWQVSGGSQAATHAWYTESLEQRKAVGTEQTPGLGQTPGRVRRGLRASSVPRPRGQSGWVSSPPSSRSESARCSPQPKSGLLPDFANKLLLKHSYTHSFTYCIWLFLYCKGEDLSNCDRDHMAPKATNIYSAVLYRIPLPTPSSRSVFSNFLDFKE